MSERRPTEKDFPLWAFSGESEGAYLFNHGTIPGSGFTHWKPAVLPAPPVKELTQREKDGEAAIAWFNTEWPKIVEQYKNALYAPAPFTVPAVWHAALAYRDRQNREDLKLIAPMLDQALSDYGIQKSGTLTNLRRRCGLET